MMALLQAIFTKKGNVCSALMCEICADTALKEWGKRWTIINNKEKTNKRN